MEFGDFELCSNVCEPQLEFSVVKYKGEAEDKV